MGGDASTALGIRRRTIVALTAVIALLCAMLLAGGPRSSPQQAQELRQTVAIIGGGASGLATAHVLRKLGFTVSILERAEQVGGHWLHAYPGVSLQNSAFHYSIPGIPFNSAHDLPHGTEIVEYFNGKVEPELRSMGVHIQLGREVVKCDFQNGKWFVTSQATEDGSASVTDTFDKLVIASGMYQKNQVPDVPGKESFAGNILTAKDIVSDTIMQSAFGSGNRVVVVGNGKSALDLTVAAASRGSSVHHVFRRAVYTVPRHVFGIPHDMLLFARHASVFMTSWDHPSSFERLLHGPLSFIPSTFWTLLSAVLGLQYRTHTLGADPAARLRVEKTIPEPNEDPLPKGLRSATALQPPAYLPLIVNGSIEPHKANVSSLSRTGVVLSSGQHLEADTVVFSTGPPPRMSFPFLPPHLREQLEGDDDGLQLYRHLVHPSVHPESLAFAGWNHGFTHIVTNAIGALWVGAVWRGELPLPSAAGMAAAVAHIRQWKRANVQLEPVRGACVSTRYQQYSDMLLAELRLTPYRKLPNVLAEALLQYGAADYATIVDEYLEARSNNGSDSLSPLDFIT